jgi:hypothetical protein
MNTFKETIFDNVIETLSKKKLSNTNNELFIDMIKNTNFCFCHLIIQDNLVVSKLYGNNLNQQGIIFQNILERKIKELILFYKLNLNNINFFSCFTDGLNFPINIKEFMVENILFINCYTDLSNSYEIILIPDFYLMENKFKKDYIESSNNNIPFFKRKPIAIFRGSQTGGIYNMQAIHKMELPRLKGVFMSRDNPQLLDIKFINSYKIQSNCEKYSKYMNKMFGPPASYEKMKDLNNNRFLLCFDGNHAPPFARPEIIMVSGSVPLFQTNYQKYWSCLLKDEINYIKINDDLLNLIPKIEFLKEHPNKAKKIADNAKELANKILNFNFQDEYIVFILKKINDKNNQN